MKSVVEGRGPGSSHRVLRLRIAKLRAALKEQFHTAPRCGTPCCCISCTAIRKVLAADTRIERKR